MVDYPFEKDLTMEQLQQVDRVEQFAEKNKLSMTPTVFWLIIWNIAFPGRDPPQHGGYYLSSNFEALVIAIQGFWVDSEEEILSDFLESRDPSPQDEAGSKGYVDAETMSQSARSVIADQLISSYFAQGERGQLQEHSLATKVLTEIIGPQIGASEV